MSVDELVTKLNDDCDVPFVRDAWIKQPSGDYGVVDIASASSIWADDKMFVQQLTVNVWLYCKDDSDACARDVQDVINSADTYGWRYIAREYLADLNMTRMSWQVRLGGL